MFTMYYYVFNHKVLLESGCILFYLSFNPYIVWHTVNEEYVLDKYRQIGDSVYRQSDRLGWDSLSYVYYQSVTTINSVFFHYQNCSLCMINYKVRLVIELLFEV